MKKRKKIPQIIGHARAPATEGSHPLRHNFAEELGSNGTENTAWQQLKQSQSGVMKDNVHQGCQESKNSETASPASSHTPRRTTNTKVKKHSPRQLLARAHQKNNPKTQKGKFMTYTVW